MSKASDRNAIVIIKIVTALAEKYNFDKAEALEFTKQRVEKLLEENPWFVLP